MNREEKFKEILEEYAKIESKMKEEKGLVFDTKIGIFGAVQLKRLFAFFTDIKLEKFEHFIDLGSGDGRAVIIASLFTKATGIEFDEELVEISKGVADKLGLDCEFICGNFLKEDLSQYDFLFINPDQGFHKGLEEKLIKEMKGVLFLNNNIFPPDKLIKGKTYWYDQIPITRYTREKEEEYFPREA